MRSGCPLGGNKSSRETKPRRGLYVARFARKWRQPSHLRFIKLLSHFSSPPTNDIRHISSFHVKFINRNLIVHHQRDPSKYTEQMKLFVYKEDTFSIPSLLPPLHVVGKERKKTRRLKQVKSRTRLFVPSTTRFPFNRSVERIVRPSLNANVNNNCQITSNERQISLEGTKPFAARRLTNASSTKKPDVPFRPIPINSRTTRATNFSTFHVSRRNRACRAWA